MLERPGISSKGALALSWSGPLYYGTAVHEWGGCSARKGRRVAFIVLGPVGSLAPSRDFQVRVAGAWPHETDGIGGLNDPGLTLTYNENSTKATCKVSRTLAKYGALGSTAALLTSDSSKLKPLDEGGRCASIPLEHVFLSLGPPSRWWGAPDVPQGTQTGPTASCAGRWRRRKKGDQSLTRRSTVGWRRVPGSWRLCLVCCGFRATCFHLRSPKMWACCFASARHGLCLAWGQNSSL